MENIAHPDAVREPAFDRLRKSSQVLERALRTEYPTLTDIERVQLPIYQTSLSAHLSMTARDVGKERAHEYAKEFAALRLAELVESKADTIAQAAAREARLRQNMYRASPDFGPIFDRSPREFHKNLIAAAERLRGEAQQSGTELRGQPTAHSR